LHVTVFAHAEDSHGDLQARRARLEALSGHMSGHMMRSQGGAEGPCCKGASRRPSPRGGWRRGPSRGGSGGAGAARLLLLAGLCLPVLPHVPLDTGWTPPQRGQWAGGGEPRAHARSAAWLRAALRGGSADALSAGVGAAPPPPAAPMDPAPPLPPAPALSARTWCLRLVSLCSVCAHALARARTLTHTTRTRIRRRPARTGSAAGPGAAVDSTCSLRAGR